MFSILLVLCFLSGFQSRVILHVDDYIGVNRMAYSCTGDAENRLYRGTCDPLVHLNNTYPRYRYKTIVNQTTMELHVQAYAEATTNNNIQMPKFRCEIYGWVTPSEVNVKCVSRNGKRIIHCIGNSNRSTCIQTT
jgi:hypothetical protein